MEREAHRQLAEAGAAAHVAGAVRGAVASPPPARGGPDWSDRSAASTPPGSPSQSSGSEADVFSETGEPGAGGRLRAGVSRTPEVAQRNFGELPHEILLLVFRHVVGSQADLRACVLVCKRW